MSGLPLLAQSRVSEKKLFRAVSSGFEYLQRYRLHCLSGQHVPVFDNPCDINKRLFLTLWGTESKA